MIRVEANKDPFDLNSGQLVTYAVLGRFQYFMTSYEFDCDEFIFAVAEKRPEFVSTNRLSSPFNNNKGAIEFIKTAIEQLPEMAQLRKLNFGVGQRPLDEVMSWIWYHRNNMNHGKMRSSRKRDGNTTFQFTRWIADEKEKRTLFHRSTYTYDLALLSEIALAAQAIRTVLRAAIESLDGEEKIS